MPNTEVKLSSAENTWMETSWEDREVLAFVYSPIAQSVERVTVNHDVVGSSPTWGASKNTDIQEDVCIFICVYMLDEKGGLRKQGESLFSRRGPQGESRYSINISLWIE